MLVSRCLQYTRAGIMTDLRFRRLLNCLLSVLLSDRKPDNEEHNSYAQVHSSFIAKHAYHEEHKCNEKESIT
jgi:hypothetical protein